MQELSLDVSQWKCQQNVVSQWIILLHRKSRQLFETPGFAKSFCPWKNFHYFFSLFESDTTIPINRHYATLCLFAGTLCYRPANMLQEDCCAWKAINYYDVFALFVSFESWTSGYHCVTSLMTVKHLLHVALTRLTHL
jgi:hypothetical protein